VTDVRISVIIPARNEAQAVAHSIHSAWLAGADEVLVVDGGSTDGTCAQAIAAGATVLTSPTAGRGAQQAWGVQHATGQVLVFLHADSTFQPNAFQPLRQLIAATESTVPSGMLWGGFRQQIRDPRWRFRLLERGNHLRAQTLGWVYGDQGLWLTRAALEAAGGFPTDPLMEDLILSRRLAGHSRPLLLETRIHTSARRWQRDGILRRTCGNWWLVLQYFAGRSTEALARAYRSADPRLPADQRLPD